MITLPDKVKCWRCGGTGIITDGVHGTNCDCDDGWRYVFDDLAAAVCEAGLFYEQKGPYPNKDTNQYRTEIVTEPRFRGWNGVIGEGSTPTAAILNAILKCNAE